MVASGGGNKVKQETKLPKVFFWAISNNDIARTFSFLLFLRQILMEYLFVHFLLEIYSIVIT